MNIIPQASLGKTVAMAATLFGLFLFACRTDTSAAVALLTQHNDLARTGANLNDTVRTTNNVNTSQFGLLFSRAVDDEIHTQPLIMTNVNIPGKGIHNLVIVATVNDTIYAFDADDSTVTNAYWQRSFLGTGVMPVKNTDMTGACGGNYRDFVGNMGIVGTPVIDPATLTLYLVVRTKESGTTFVQRLHALDLTTGTEKLGGPVVITATYPGTGDGGTTVTFNSQHQNQRSALALINGIVYITWSSHCDWGPYHGWIIGYDAATLQRAVVYNDTPNGYEGGIWMSDQALPADESGNLYVSTGNGHPTVDVNPRDPLNHVESVLKLTRSGTNLSVASWFVPYNFTNLENGDVDLGSGGVLLIPGTNLLFTGGKQGKLYLLNRDNLGGMSGSTSADTNIIQSFSTGSHEIHGGPVWWDAPDGSYAYVWPASSDHLRQYKFDRALGQFSSTSPYAQSVTTGGSGQPGGILSLSASGTNSGTGIVWASVNTSGNANQGTVAGTLHAYNAQNVALELWNSDMLSSRDSLGNFAKFVAPTVANGKVYIATFSNALKIYGLFPPPKLTITLSGGNVVLSWPTNNASAYVLQGNTNLVGPNWSNIVSTLIITNGAYTTTVPTTNSPSFYRLKR